MAAPCGRLAPHPRVAADRCRQHCCVSVGTMPVCVILRLVLQDAFDQWTSCSDDITDYTLTGLGEAMDGVYTNNLLGFLIDLFSLFFKVYGCLTLSVTKVYTNYDEYVKAKESARDAAVDGGEKTNDFMSGIGQCPNPFA